MEEFKYLRVFFTSEGKMEQEIDRRIRRVRVDAGSALVRRGEDLPVDLRSYPHLWSRTLGSDQKNKIAGTSS